MDKIAIVFAGQGAQFAGMGKSFYESFSSVKSLFDIAESIRPGTLGTCFNGSGQELKDTANTQPCLYLANVGAALALKESGIYANSLAGFSLGEVSALAFSGAVSLETGFEIAVRRGAIMKKAADSQNASMMAVVRLEVEVVEELCKKVFGVYPVNYNSLQQTVVAGSKESLGVLKDEVTAVGGRGIMLPVSGAFHSPYMDGASAEFRKYIRTVPIGSPKTKLYSNVTALPYEGDMAELLCRQINSPVRWTHIVKNMQADGVSTFIEVGAGSVLCKLIKQIYPNAAVFSVEKTEDISCVLEALKK